AARPPARARWLRLGAGALRAVWEVQEGPARRRPALALILAAVRRVHRRRQAQERQLADAHAEVDRDRQPRDVGELERDVPVPAWVDVASGRVDEQAETAEAR